MLRQRRQAHPAHRRHRGWSLLEVTIVLFVIALAAAGVYGLANTTTTDVRARNMIGDIQAVLTTAKSAAATLSTYEDLTSAVIIDGDRLDDRLIDGTDIVIEGSAGNDYIVDLAAGGAATSGNAVGAATNRFFIMAIQNIEEVQDCIAIMSFDHPYLRGVLADPGNATDATAIPAANATNSWQNPPQSGRELIDRTTADVQAACTTAAGTDGLLTVHLGLR